MEERLREEGLLADKTAAYRPVSGDADFFMNYEDDGFTGTSISDFGAMATIGRAAAVALP